MNIRQLRRNRKLANDYIEGVEAAYKARDNYEQLWKNLNEEREYYQKLQEEEKKDEEI